MLLKVVCDMKGFSEGGAFTTSVCVCGGGSNLEEVLSDEAARVGASRSDGGRGMERDRANRGRGRGRGGGGGTWEVLGRGWRGRGGMVQV